MYYHMIMWARYRGIASKCTFQSILEFISPPPQNAALITETDTGKKKLKWNIINVPPTKISLCYQKVQVNIGRALFLSQTRFFSHHYVLLCSLWPISQERWAPLELIVQVSYPPLSFAALLAGYFWHTWSPCSCEFHFQAISMSARLYVCLLFPVILHSAFLNFRSHLKRILSWILIANILYVGESWCRN